MVEFGVLFLISYDLIKKNTTLLRSVVFKRIVVLPFFEQNVCVINYIA